MRESPLSRLPSAAQLPGESAFCTALRSVSQVDVRCFLFTDMLLVCKPLTKKGDKVRVIRQPYVIDRLVVQEGAKDAALLCVYLNEYQLATAAFTLYCPESRHCKVSRSTAWILAAPVGDIGSCQNFCCQ